MEKQRAVTDKHRKVAAASADGLLAMMSSQPPHELINVIALAIEDLVNAAAGAN